MAYTRAWSSATPIGSSTDANQIDDVIREKLLDVEERVNTIIGADSDIDQDPVVAAGYDLSALYAAQGSLTGALGSVAGIKRTQSWWAGTIIGTPVGAAQTMDKVVVTGASGVIQVWIPMFGLPVGAQITDINILAIRNDAGHDITAVFKGWNSAGLAASSTIATVGLSASVAWYGQAFAHTILADAHYGWDVTVDNNNVSTSTDLALYAVRVTITHPGGAVR